ncbi:MAG: aminodeoxychorismate lyase [Burkholderiales bacterium]
MILVDGLVSEALSALDRGLAYGDGVYRTMRAESGRVLHWPRHHRKLEHDCARLGIACLAAPVLSADIARILRAEPDCVLKIIVTRGQGGRGFAPPMHTEPTRVVASFPLPPPPQDCDEHGVRVRWCSTRLAAQPALAGVKHLNRLENVLARSEWTDPTIAEGIMLDAGGDVVEGTMSNVFILEQGRLITPALERCGVAGVQRERLIALAERICRGCEVGSVSPQRLLAADQVYLLNSVIGAWWVSALEARTWKRSELTPVLQSALRADDG